MANKPSTTGGKIKTATGRTLAHQSRHSRTLSKSSKVKAGKAAAKALISGAKETTQARINAEQAKKK